MTTTGTKWTTILSFLLASCQSFLPEGHEKAPAIQLNGKSFVRLVLKNVSDTVKVHSSYWPLLPFGKEYFTEELKVVSDSTFVLTFNTSVAAKYDLELGKNKTLPVFLVPADTLTVTADYAHGEHPQAVSYEGIYSSINQYLHDKPGNIAFSMEGARLFNDPFRLETPEKTLMLYKRATDSIAAVQKSYLETKAEQYNLPAWFVGLENYQNALFAAYHQMMVPSYWKQFFNVEVAIPEEYFDSVKTIDITDRNGLLSGLYYLYVVNLITYMPEIEQYRKSFMDSLGVDNLDKLKGTGHHDAYEVNLFKTVSEKADELLSDELFRPFLTNYFFIAIRPISPSHREEVLNYASSKLAGTDYASLILNHYEDLSTHLAKGATAPGFYLLSDQQNRSFELKDFGGKVILLNFWFPGCKPCIAEIPHEKALMKRYGDKNFSVVNICMEATVNQWRTALKRYDLAGINLVTQGNWERKIKEAYGVVAFPHYVLIDREGKIIANNTFRPSDPRLAESIEAALIDVN